MIIWLTIFSVAMAFVESAVVVYLRFLYYPEGFTFPIVLAPYKTAFIELGREAATILMLYSVARLTYKKSLNRFCAFIFCFGVWDIFYYIWLYVCLKWPPGLLTWDILFLLPIPWIGPVLAPMLVALTMIVAAVIILKLDERGIAFHNTVYHWAAAILAGLIIILSFTIDLKVVIDQTVPTSFKWGILAVGEALGLGVFLHALRETMRRRNDGK